MTSNRRTFLRIGLGAAASGLLSLATGKDEPPVGIKIGDRMRPRFTDQDLESFRQTGTEYATIWTSIEDANFEYMITTRRRLETAQIQLLNIGILDLHCDPTIVLGLPGQDEKIEQYKAYLNNLGRAGISYTTYAHMANIKLSPYYQTGVGTTRGGARTRLFDMEEAKKLPLSHGREYSEDEIWQSFTKFIRAVMPVAEKNHVRIGLHPDDPPVPMLGGVPRVFRNLQGYQRAIEIADSDYFGLCFCIGTWAEGGGMMGKDVPDTIRYYGPQKRIFKCHFRNIDKPLPRFQEEFVDTGYLNMYDVMKALREVNFDGVIIPDHVPQSSPANNAFTIGYMKALRDRVNSEAQNV